MTTDTPLSPPLGMVFRMRPLSSALAMAPLALACAGCALPGAPSAPLHLAPPVEAPAAPWWADADPLLVQLITQGLSQDAALACQSDTLIQRENKAHARKLKARLTRLMAPRDTPASRLAAAYALAQSRATLASAIARAYVEVRRWQERIALRAQALAPLADNAEIARFRREAGLVSALDGDMADLMTGLDTAGVETARAHLSDALATLAGLTGTTPDDLRILLGPEGHVPLMPAPPAGDDIALRPDLLALQTRLAADMARHKVTQETLDAQLAEDAVPSWSRALTRARADVDHARTALDTANARLEPLDQTEALAARAVSDARLSYRNGTDSFATLYVAEGIALAAHERRVDIKATIAAATVALWTARGAGWQAGDLAPAPPGTACVQP